MEKIEVKEAKGKLGILVVVVGGAVADYHGYRYVGCT